MTKIYVAGHRGMVGGAILRRLQARKDAGEALEFITRTHAPPTTPSTSVPALRVGSRLGAGKVTTPST